MRVNVRVVLACLVAFATLSACSSKGPDQSRPHALVLADAPTHQAAKSLAEELIENHPELEGSAALSVHGETGGVRHLVLGPPNADPSALRHLRARLAGDRPLRLSAVDVRKLSTIDSEHADGASPPEETEAFDSLASLLPAPGDDRMTSFLLHSDPGEGQGPVPLPGGHSGTPAFARAFASIGFAGTAEASYTAVNGNGRVMVFAGWLGPSPTADRDAAKLIYNFLLPYVRPQVVVEEAEPEEEKVSKKKRRKRKRKLKRKARGKRKAKRKAKRKRKRQKPDPEPEEAALVPVVKDLPAAVAGLMPWGEAQVVLVERVGLTRTARSRKARKNGEALLTAWIAVTPERDAVVMVLFDDPVLAKRICTPDRLGPPSGLNHSEWVHAVWAVLPDVTLEGERFEYLGMQRFAKWLPRAQRTRAWAKPHLERAVLMAGYRAVEGKRARWQMNWMGSGDPAAAKVLYEQGFVAPRQALMQTVIKAKKAVSFDVGVTLREIGDVQGWLLTGAGRGSLQELYFQSGSQIWLVRSGVESRKGLSADELLGRVELFQLWDSPVR
jgi:hypothetical protein